MNEIVTVTCTRDKWCMVLQAHSLEVFIKDSYTHYVIIEDDQTDITEWERLLTPIYNNHRLVLITKNTHPTLYPANITNGWYRQQFIKFLAHHLINGDRYLILDSKNIFIKSIDLKGFKYEGSGSRMTYDDPWMQYWTPWINHISKMLSKPIPKLFWIPVTPFLVDKHTVKKLLEVCNFEKIILDALADKRLPISEFLLYAFFSDTEHPEIHMYGGGYQKGDVESTLELFHTITTFALGRINLQNPIERNVIKHALCRVGLDAIIVENAVSKTLMDG